VDCFFVFLAVAGEEDGSCSGTVAHADDIAFLEQWEGRVEEDLWWRIERLIESLLA
jgi:hypothetical protein